MGTIKIMWSKENVYSICVGDEAVARRLLDGNLWFIKGTSPWTPKKSVFIGNCKETGCSDWLCFGNRRC
ncbi:hypothetical protein L3X38_032850 [Prunus dulcis]|uniref:Uncharacterized protein n=1 Tax=Prunus dulcis TaxID=3755 RepID=A0AAD4VF40_PRUDU|nr:hypothetical protein L3X38_032850 [Prunus dulcis]